MSERFPTQDDIGARSIQSSQGTTNINVGARGAMGDEITYLGKTLEVVGEERRERKERDELAEAELDFAKKSSAIRLEFADRTDYENFEAEHETKMQSALGESKKLISGARSQKTFDMKSKLSLFRGRDRIHSMARGLEVDQGRSNLDQKLSETRTMILESDDPAERAQFQTVVQDSLSAAEDNGYISKVERQNMGRDYVRDVVRGTFDMKDAAGKMEMLKDDPLMEYLDGDEKAKLEKVAEKELKFEQRERESQARETAWELVANGRDPDDFSPAVKALLGSQHSSMRNMHKNLQKTDSPYAANTDKVAMAKALALPNDQIAVLDLNEYKAKSTEADFARLVMRQEKAKHAIQADAADPKMAGIIERSLKQMAPMSMAWGSSKNGDDKRAMQNLARDEMTDWVQTFIEQNKRKPTEDEVRTEAAHQMVQVETDPGYTWFSETNSGFDLEDLDEERKAVARVPYDTINKRVLDDIESNLRSRGIEPEEDLVEQLAGASALNDHPRILKLMSSGAQ